MRTGDSPIREVSYAARSSMVVLSRRMQYEGMACTLSAACKQSSLLCHSVAGATGRCNLQLLGLSPPPSTERHWQMQGRCFRTALLHHATGV